VARCDVAMIVDAASLRDNGRFLQAISTTFAIRAYRTKCAITSMIKGMNMRRILSLRSVGLSMLVLCSASLETRALTLPDSSWVPSKLCAGAGGCTSSESFSGGTETLTVPFNNGVATSEGQGAVTSQSSPSLTATATTSVINPNISPFEQPLAQTLLIFTYSMELLGPSAPVAVIVNSNASITGNPRFGSAELDITYDEGDATLLDERAGAESSNGLVPSFSISTSETISPNEIYTITMTAAASAQDSNPSESVSIDPYFQLTPAEIAEGYSLQFSNGVGNGPDVAETPLPAALPLFTGGLGLIGFVGRRRKKQVTA
jgi:hypothetical protein